MNLIQLVGNDLVNIGLFDVPNGIDAQELFNEVFDKVIDVLDECDDDYDNIFDGVIELLEEEHNIKRVYVEEVYTDKL